VPQGNFYNSLQSLLHEPASAVYKTAIEAVGKVGEFSLWRDILDTALQYNATGALTKSIIHFGDDIFAADYIPASQLPDNFTTTVIKTAGKIKGNYSTTYLLAFLRPESEFKDLVIEALFQKRAQLVDFGEKEVVSWLETKLEQSKLKINFYTRLASHPSLALLATAVKSEIEQDLPLILKAFALLYDRQRLERVLHLLKSSGDSRISNAIEMLELSIPKRYFLQVDAVLEFLLDISVSKTESPALTATIPTMLIKEVLTTSAAGFNVWTKSVALYLIPAFKDKALRELLLEKQVEDKNPLFGETRKFVLSQVEL